MRDSGPATTLHQLIMGFQDTHLVYVAAELRLADLLKDGPRRSDDLAALAGANAEALHRILRGLAQLGVLTYENAHFGLTPVGQLLRSDVPGSRWASARMWGSPFFQRPFVDLLHTVTTGEAAFDHTFGQDFFAYLEAHPEERAVFDQGMTSSSARSIDAILAAYDFSGLGSLVDVGGGQGAVLAAILRAHPALRGVLFDRPQLQEEALRSLAAAGLAERCRFVAGSFFEAVPEGADAYLLRAIIHDWDDAAGVAILRACRRAMPRHGKVLVIGRLLPPGNQPALDAVRLDLAMLALLKGRERTETEFCGLFEQAELRLRRTIPLPSGEYILEAVPA